jgi:hypothetical protein
MVKTEDFSKQMLPNLATSVLKRIFKILVYKYHAVRLRQSAMIAKFTFQVSTFFFQTVIGVWYSYFHIFVPCPQIGHITAQTQICAAQTFVHIITFLRFFVLITFFKEIAPGILPLLKPSDKTFFLNVIQQFNNIQKFNGCI